MSAERNLRAYRSIFWEPDWAHQKYFGWECVLDEPGLRVLQKRQSIVSRYLVLLESNGVCGLENAVSVISSPLSEVVIHDFENSVPDLPESLRMKFRPMAGNERLLNIATLVIDLGLSEEHLLSAMSSDYRRKIRKAPSQGVSVEACADPDAKLQKQFLDAFEEFTQQRNFKSADRDAIQKMYRNRDAILFVARNENKISNFLHIYFAGDKAIFMHGVNLSKKNDGAGQFLHWQAIRHLRSMGLKWYDFGGVTSFDPGDGIYNFKRKFGAQEIELGKEWMKTPAPLKALKSLVQLARR